MRRPIAPAAPAHGSRPGFVAPVAPVAPVSRVAGAGDGVDDVFRSHYRDVYRYLLLLTRSPDEAEEIAAETFERAFRAALGGRGPDLDRPLPWLLLAARRIATDRWRRGRRALLRTIGLEAPATGDAGELRTEFWLWFESLAAALTERQREVLVLRYQRDLTDEDIARILGLSPSGVRSLVARALAALRSHPELLP